MGILISCRNISNYLIIALLLSSCQIDSGSMSMPLVDCNCSDSSSKQLRVIIEIGQSNAMAYGCCDRGLGALKETNNVFIKNIKVVDTIEHLIIGQNSGGQVYGNIKPTCQSIGTLYAAQQDNLLILKHAVGSTLLVESKENTPDWNSNSINELLDETLLGLDYVKNWAKQKDKEAIITDIIWIQGESDALSIRAAFLYKRNLEKLVIKLNNKIKCNPNWHIGRISNRIGQETFKYWRLVRAGQETIANEYNFINILNLDDCSMVDEAHLNCECLHEIANQI